MAPPYGRDTTGTELVQDFASDIKGKVILTTGVSPGGLGATFVEAIAKAQPALLILAGRNVSKGEQTARTIKEANPEVEVRTLKLDLDSLAGARQAAEELNSWGNVPHIDVLVNNASIMGTPYAKTVDGIESQFATNHLGPFLFSNLIMKKLLASKSPRLVNVSSDGHRMSPIRFHDYNFDDGKTYNKWVGYGQSKTGNNLFALSLAEKLGKQGLIATSLHPGVILTTGLGTHIDWATDTSLFDMDKTLGNKEGWAGFNPKTADQGIATHVFAAFSPTLRERNGAYLEDSQVADPRTYTLKPWATSSLEAEMLWELSEKLVGQKFSY